MNAERNKFMKIKLSQSSVQAVHMISTLLGIWLLVLCSSAVGE